MSVLELVSLALKCGDDLTNIDRYLGHVSLPSHALVYILTAYSDFADEYPEAEVIGSDLSPIQPT